MIGNKFIVPRTDKSCILLKFQFHILLIHLCDCGSTARKQSTSYHSVSGENRLTSSEISPLEFICYHFNGVLESASFSIRFNLEFIFSIRCVPSILEHLKNLADSRFGCKMFSTARFTRIFDLTNIVAYGNAHPTRE